MKSDVPGSLFAISACGTYVRDCLLVPVEELLGEGTYVTVQGRKTSSERSPLVDWAHSRQLKSVFAFQISVAST